MIAIIEIEYIFILILDVLPPDNLRRTYSTKLPGILQNY